MVSGFINATRSNTFLAAYLAEIERRFLQGRSIADPFDMIAGPSTGGILALALAHGMTAQQALQVDTERGERIFPTLKGWRKVARLLRWVSKSKHDQEILKAELLAVFGDKVLDDATKRLVVPSFEVCTASRSSTRHRTILTTRTTGTRSSPTWRYTPRRRHPTTQRWMTTVTS